MKDPNDTRRRVVFIEDNEVWLESMANPTETVRRRDKQFNATTITPYEGSGPDVTDVTVYTPQGTPLTQGGMTAALKAFREDRERA